MGNYGCIIQCRYDLQCDEEIFAKEEHKFNQIKERNAELEADNERLASRLSEAESANSDLENQLLAKQLELDRISARLEAFILLISDCCISCKLLFIHTIYY